MLGAQNIIFNLYYTCKQWRIKDFLVGGLTAVGKSLEGGLKVEVLQKLKHLKTKTIIHRPYESCIVFGTKILKITKIQNFEI